MTIDNETIQETQYAVQLTGPEQLVLNKEKPVARPVGFQILGKVEATGLCFSDLKLLKQFDKHPRKGNVVSGMDLGEVRKISSYVPANETTVLGHETVIRIVAVGDEVRGHKVGERCLVQTDYRWLHNDGGGNASFGYNFEGGLQEYVIFDERVSRDFDTNERFLIPVGEEKSASAICLVEPWACIEDSYMNEERRTILAGGELLVVADPGRAVEGLAESFSPGGGPARIRFRCADAAQREAVGALGAAVEEVDDLASLADDSIDDIVYFGADGETIESLSPKLAERGIANIVTGGARIGRPVAIGVGRIHYGQKRWVGTLSSSAAESYKIIPATGEVRDGDRCLVMGAAGPMGQMHVMRNLSLGLENFSVVGTDMDASRLERLADIAAPLAESKGFDLRLLNTQEEPVEGEFSYVALMVPSAELLVEAIDHCGEGALINVFAGIPAPTVHPVDLDRLIEKRCFLFGTSGSLLRDMKMVLKKVEANELDTNCSVGAISGMAGAIAGMEAVENRTVAGKIIVYPGLYDLGLIPIEELAEKLPSVAEKLREGQWTKEAEEELKRVGA